MSEHCDGDDTEVLCFGCFEVCGPMHKCEPKTATTASNAQTLDVKWINIHQVRPWARVDPKHEAPPVTETVVKGERPKAEDESCPCEFCRCSHEAGCALAGVPNALANCCCGMKDAARMVRDTPPLKSPEAMAEEEREKEGAYRGINLCYDAHVATPTPLPTLAGQAEVGALNARVEELEKALKDASERKTLESVFGPESCPWTHEFKAHDAPEPQTREQYHEEIAMARESNKRKMRDLKEQSRRLREQYPPAIRWGRVILAGVLLFAVLSASAWHVLKTARKPVRYQPTVESVKYWGGK